VDRSAAEDTAAGEHRAVGITRFLCLFAGQAGPVES
jgi:hypothetical protein